MAIYKLSFWNASLLSLVFCVIGMFFMARRKDVAKRISDMAGYTSMETVITAGASLAPYPFI